VLSLVIAAVEHQVGALRRFTLGVGSVPSDHQVGGALDTMRIEMGDVRVPLPAWAQAIIK
jgi:hypothetical protein